MSKNEIIPLRGYKLEKWESVSYRSTAIAYMEREGVFEVPNINGKMYTLDQLKESLLVPHSLATNENAPRKVNSILQVAQCLLNHEITINTDFEGPTSGYVVAMTGGLVLREPSLEDVLVFVRRNYDLPHKAYFGSRKDNGLNYFDISFNFATEEAATVFGRVHKQQAIWGVKEKRIIRIS